MALAPFFSRAYSAIGAHLGITREELEKVLSNTVVGIHLATTCSIVGNDKWIAEMLVNLLSRLYPTLSITGDATACEAISAAARSINPNIELLNSPNDATVIVIIGAEPIGPKSFSVGASGWVARVGGDVGKIFSNGPPNPYSAGAAAALGAWRVFQSVVVCPESNVMIPDISLSLLDYSENAGSADHLPAIEIGEVAVAGIGAVGNPALWAWSRHAGLTGEIHLIDPEDVDLSNLQRYCLPVHADVGMGKVQLAQRELRDSALRLKSWPCSLEDFASSYSGIDRLPTICVSVDNVAGRRAAQALMPRLVVNGWTSDSGLGASWHRFLGTNACLGCFYHPKGISLSQTEMAAKALGLPHEELAALWVSEKPLGAEEVITIEAHLGMPRGHLMDWIGKRVQDVYSGVICGQVGVDLVGIGKVVTVPLAHQSVLAGILMAAELVKHSLLELEERSQRAPLVIWDDVKRSPPKYWTVMRTKESECFCNDLIYKQVFAEKWQRSDLELP